MRAGLRANIELVTQVVVAIAIVITAGVLVKRTVFSTEGYGTRSQINAGDRLNVPTIDWAQNRKSLVFFLRRIVPIAAQAQAFTAS